ncbi:MAG: ATP-binding protein [Candidatus Magasanikbacteria bacterium]|nr:ATP-binding protein [Candidatus Magasanikbacteria bacterium]
MLIDRTILKEIQKSLNKAKTVTILYGPRQAGKTTILNEIANTLDKETIKQYDGGDLYAQEVFGRPELSMLKKTIGNAKYIFIDEAQKIPNIGLTLKLIVDHSQTKTIVSGSASFDLADKLNEPLTGRTDTLWLYPLSYGEIKNLFQQTSNAALFDNLLRFGMFPKIHQLNSDDEKQKYLTEYVNTYLYNDLLTIGNIKKPKKVIDLLSLLALQIGQEVSVSGLSCNLGLSHQTVDNYLDVLEKMFVIYNVRGLSRNLRKEINKTSKYYFLDLGLRNAIIRNFNQLSLRSDTGQMFENWFVMERIKFISNSQKFANFYFWRTYDQKEIDLVEERDGKMLGFECKWSETKKIKKPSEWLKTYQNSAFVAINRENFTEYL